MGSNTIQATAVGIREILDVYWKLEKKDLHTVNNVYELIAKRRKLAPPNEIETKIKIIKVLDEKGLEPSQTENQTLTEVARKIALRLQRTMGSNRVGKYLSIPYREIDEVFDAEQMKLDAIKWERRLGEKVEELEGKIAVEKNAEKKNEMLRDLRRVSQQLEDIKNKKEN